MTPRFSRDFIGGRGAHIAGLILLAFALDVAAAVSMGYVAGFHAVQMRLSDFHPAWLAAVAGGLVASFFGYYLAYREIYRTDDGPMLPARRLAAVVVAGFGGYFAHGGAALDQYALEGAGAGEREAKVRVSALAGLEHGALGIVGTGAATAALILARPKPPFDFQYPWAVIPVPGMLFAFWLAERYKDALRCQGGFKEKLGLFADSISLIRTMFADCLNHGGGPIGMCAFWLAELWSGWAALAVFGVRMDPSSYLVGFLTAAVFTRRTGPFAGAGILMVTLSVTLWYSGAPFGDAILGIFTYRLLGFWLPLPLSVASLPTLRKMGRRREPGAESQAVDDHGEPALEGGVA